MTLLGPEGLMREGMTALGIAGLELMWEGMVLLEMGPVGLIRDGMALLGAAAGLVALPWSAGGGGKGSRGSKGSPGAGPRWTTTSEGVWGDPGAAGELGPASSDVPNCKLKPLPVAAA